MKDIVRKNLLWILFVMLLCAGLPASAEVKFSRFPKKNELYLQWKPFKRDTQYPEVRDEGDRIVIEGASSMGFTARAMQTYAFVTYPGSDYTAYQWDRVNEKKKGNGEDRIILLKPSEDQLAAFPDDSRPLPEFPPDNNPDFDLSISHDVKSPLSRITLKYNPRWTLEENGLTFSLRYRDGSLCHIYPDGFYLQYYNKSPAGSLELDYPFDAQYDAEGRLIKAIFHDVKKTGAMFEYKRVSEDPLWYTVTRVFLGPWSYHYQEGVWTNSETNETTETAPDGINLNKLPFKVIGDPGAPPSAEVLRTESAPGLVELPQEKAVYASWPGGTPLDIDDYVSSSDAEDVYYDADRKFLRVSRRLGETFYSMVSSPDGDGLYVSNPFPGGSIEEARYDPRTGALDSYWVSVPWQGNTLKMFFTCNESLGAENGIPEFRYADLYTCDEEGNITEEKHWSCYKGSWTLETSDGAAACDPPPFADLCTPLPLIVLEP